MSDSDKFNNTKITSTLYGLEDKFDFLSKLYLNKKFPKVIMLSGKKGVGKLTLIAHFLNSIFDKNYNLKTKTMLLDSPFNKQFLNNSFSNIIILNGSNFKNIKIDDIRILKSLILKSTLLNKERFIILDDIELFNNNSLNALLKIIEEPTSNNHFILINNKSKDLLQTISSRCVELKILLSNQQRISIINSLIIHHNIEELIDYKSSAISPGQFFLLNNLCMQNQISLDEDLIINIENLLNFYKKSKNYQFIDLILFITENYYLNQSRNKNKDLFDLYEEKQFIIDNIQRYIKYNINQSLIISAINNKLSNV